jgi:hypothetical protein
VVEKDGRVVEVEVMRRNRRKREEEYGAFLKVCRYRYEMIRMNEVTEEEEDRRSGLCSKLSLGRSMFAGKMSIEQGSPDPRRTSCSHSILGPVVVPAHDLFTFP